MVMKRMNARLRGIVLAAFCLGLAWVGAAEDCRAGMITLAPNGLSPGSQYRLAFVTSQTHNATSSSISTYNDFVTSVAHSNPALAALETSWRAIAVTTSVGQTRVRENTGTEFTSGVPTGVPIYLLDGTLIAANYNDLWDGHIASQLSIDEFGQSVNDLDPNGGIISSIRVWTGGTFGGGVGGPSGLGSPRPTYGDTRFTSGDWIATANQDSDPSNMLERAFYGISDVLTVPEPVVETQQFLLNVNYGTGSILSGELAFGLTELPENVQAQFLIKGDPNATSFTLDNVLSASTTFGDGQWTELESFLLERDPITGEVTGLDYSFGAIDTETVLMGITVNFPLTITGTDKATGQTFEYQYTTSVQSFSAVPEPDSFLLMALGLSSVMVFHPRRRKSVTQA